MKKEGTPHLAKFAKKVTLIHHSNDVKTIL